jgi:uncharacterized membrane protein
MKSFFKTLFDHKFETYITRSIAGIAYLILAWCAVAVGGILFLMTLSRALTFADAGSFLLSLVIPVLTFVVVIMLRLAFEASTALVAVAENTSKAK